ncbi:uncharacterized protein LOC131349131 [Hemibagrus wyckioides]|uniref:uncharacterized protein LOC131349131 n=1 Tax=Hemibagrus wyckioides TaxID=337641 RepID=UPI00266CEAF5|nr:uncharacterized protein LOC131349131 [Hemibagrus wyckioides]
MELLHQGEIQDVVGIDPHVFLWAVSLPVHQTARLVVPPEPGMWAPVAISLDPLPAYGPPQTDRGTVIHCGHEVDSSEFKNINDFLIYVKQGICIFLLQWILTHQQVNVAPRGIATQSSLMFNNFYASFAIDGNRASNMGSYSCTHTNIQNNPWWRVDLLAVYDITKVIVTNRGDCCPERINGAEIHIGNSLVNNGNNDPRCAVIYSIPAGGSASYTCNMRGRYVNVFIPGVSRVLTLCEVEVYGVAVPVTKRAFLKLKFNSTEDLSNLTIMDKVLQKIKSANVQSSVFQIRWTKEPELKDET